MKDAGHAAGPIFKSDVDSASSGASAGAQTVYWYLFANSELANKYELTMNKRFLENLGHR